MTEEVEILRVGIIVRVNVFKLNVVAAEVHCTLGSDNLLERISLARHFVLVVRHLASFGVCLLEEDVGKIIPVVDSVSAWIVFALHIRLGIGSEERRILRTDEIVQARGIAVSLVAAWLNNLPRFLGLQVA